MGELLKYAGLVSFMLVVLYTFKQINVHYDLERAGYYEDDNVYKAAKEFARGAPSEEVRTVLSNCTYMDDKDVEEILSQALPHRTDKDDGGYRAFIKSVNKVMGEEIYGYMDERTP